MTTLILIPTVPGNEQWIQPLIADIFKHFTTDYHLLILKNNYEGFARTINKGLDVCSLGMYEDILLLNDDIIIDKDILKLLKEKLWSNDKIGLVAPKSCYRNNYCAFYCVLFKREVRDKIGLLDERFEVGECEDVDYCVRIQENGYIFDLIDEDVVHFYSRTISTLTEEQQKKIRMNKIKFKEKYKETKWENIIN